VENEVLSIAFEVNAELEVEDRSVQNCNNSQWNRLFTAWFTHSLMYQYLWIWNDCIFCWRS